MERPAYLLMFAPIPTDLHASRLCLQEPQFGPFCIMHNSPSAEKSGNEFLFLPVWE